MDLFYGPGSLQAWAMAAPTKQSLAAYARATIRAAHAAHPCPAVPQTTQAITIGGAPARLMGMDCPAGSGFLVETAVTIHDGTAFVFASQDQAGTPATHPADRAASATSSAASRFRGEGAELCMCADEVLYTVTARSPDGTAVTVGPMSRASPLDPDVVAGIASLLREEHPDAEITVESGPNPDYRPDCFRVIPEDAAHVEYVGASRGPRDNRYCQRCAIGIWGE